MKLRTWVRVVAAVGAILAIATAGFVIFGLVQDAGWSWYTWLLLVGVAFVTLIILFVVVDFPESRRSRTNNRVDPPVLPHKTTPRIAIASGLLALISAAAGLIMNLKEIDLGLIYIYAATGFLGIVSLALGLLLLMQRSRALSTIRSELLHLEGTSPIITYDLRRLAEQREALLTSGDLSEAGRVAEILRLVKSRRT